MRKPLSALILAAGLLAAPLSTLSHGAVARTVSSPRTLTLSAQQKSKKTPTPAQVAFRARQKKCGAEWKAAKAACKIEKGMK